MEAPEATTQTPDRDLQNPDAVRCISCPSDASQYPSSVKPFRCPLYRRPWRPAPLMCVLAAARCPDIGAFGMATDGHKVDENFEPGRVEQPGPGHRVCREIPELSVDVRKIECIGGIRAAA